MTILDDRGKAVTRTSVSRRLLLSGAVVALLAGFPRSVRAQRADPRLLPPIRQPAAASKAAFLARAHELRDQAAAAGDQPYGAVIVRNGLIVGEGLSQVVTLIDPTAHSELMAVRDAARRLGTRTLSDCEMYSSATPCPMCQGALYWAGVRRVFTAATLEDGFVPRLGC